MEKDYKRAAESYAYAALLDEGNPKAHFHASECFSSLEHKDAAKEALKSAEKVAKRQPTKHKTLLGKIKLIKQKRS